MPSPLHRLQAAMASRGLDAFIVADPGHRRWLTGYNSVYRRGYVLVTAQAASIVTYQLEAEQARRESFRSEGDRIPVVQCTDPAAALADLLRQTGARAAGFDTDLGGDLLWRLSQQQTAPLVPAFGLMATVRAVKEADEIAGFRQAAALHDRALTYMEGIMRAGQSEAEMRAELDAFLLREGAEAFTFESVILAGAQSALPHARPGSYRAKTGDLITIDFGAIVAGSDGDVCRTYVVGEPTPEQRAAYAVIVAAQRAAIAACVPGNTGHDVDQAARQVIAEAGFGDCFTHAVGHGLISGPNLSPGSPDQLQPGNIVAVEPGPYWPGVGGMRVEDVVLVTAAGPERLTHHPADRLKGL